MVWVVVDMWVWLLIQLLWDLGCGQVDGLGIWYAVSVQRLLVWPWVGLHWGLLDYLCASWGHPGVLCFCFQILLLSVAGLDHLWSQSLRFCAVCCQLDGRSQVWLYELILIGLAILHVWSYWSLFTLKHAEVMRAMPPPFLFCWLHVCIWRPFLFNSLPSTQIVSSLVFWSQVSITIIISILRSFIAFCSKSSLCFIDPMFTVAILSWLTCSCFWL